VLKSMNSWSERAILVTSFILITSVAHANQINVTFNGVSPTNPTLTIKDSFAGFGPETGYIDPYKGTIGGQSVLLFCVDPFQMAPSVGKTWTVNVETPGNVSSMSTSFQMLNTPLTGRSGLTDNQADLLYEEMARLIVMLEVPSNTKLTEQEIQAAIWQVADPNLTFPNAPSGFSLTQVNSFENDARANPLTSGFEVLTDSNDKYQEYVVLTPEPSTFLMVGSGLIGLFVFSRNRAISKSSIPSF
jgi:hypothetical protein